MPRGISKNKLSDVLREENDIGHEQTDDFVQYY